MSGVVAFIRRCIGAGMDVEAALGAAEQFENGDGELFASPSQITAFAEFWKAYPNKVGKRDAETSYNKAVKRSRHTTIMEGLERARHCRRWGEGYIPNPATWLNQDRWLDEPDETPHAPLATPGMMAAASDEMAFQAVRRRYEDVDRDHDPRRVEGPGRALPAPTNGAGGPRALV